MSPSQSVHRRVSIVAVLALILAACGGGEGDAIPEVVTTAPANATTPDSAAPAANTPEDGSVTTTTTGGANSGERPAPNPDRQIAPDFTLNLGSGSTFVLSEETRPVFMVFWAEW
jgi:ABC-type glycerol-3-phosphate transport system substrate-binding protein